MNRLQCYNCWPETDERHVGPFPKHIEQALNANEFLRIASRAVDFVDATRCSVTICTGSGCIAVNPGQSVSEIVEVGRLGNIAPAAQHGGHLYIS